MRSKADETLVIVETLISILFTQIVDLLFTQIVVLFTQFTQPYSNLIHIC